MQRSRNSGPVLSCACHESRLPEVHGEWTAGVAEEQFKREACQASLVDASTRLQSAGPCRMLHVRDSWASRIPRQEQLAGWPSFNACRRA